MNQYGFFDGYMTKTSSDSGIPAIPAMQVPRPHQISWADKARKKVSAAGARGRNRIFEMITRLQGMKPGGLPPIEDHVLH